MTIAVVMTSCSKEEVVIPNPVEQVVDGDNEVSERTPTFIGYGPCGPTGGLVVPHIKTESHCNLYWGFLWEHGKCWACY